jgi:hypothetical protein
MVLLPLVAALLIYRGWLGGYGRREAVLRASLVFAAILAFGTEALSLLGALSPFGVATFWALVVLVAWVWQCQQSRAVAAQAWGLDALLVPIGSSLVVTLVVALIAAPNTTDAMTYHLARVGAWLQHCSLRNYATNVDRQLYMSPWAEYAILHLQVLSFGSDRLVNLVQWTAYAGSATVASLTAERLGASTRAGWVAAALVVTTPMCVLQASSTQNDLVNAYFTACVAYFAFSGGGPRSAPWLGVALALALMTKGTAYVLCAPFVLVYLARLSRRSRPRAALAAAAVIGVCVVALNAGVWSRNYATFGHPLGDPVTLAALRTDSLTPARAASNLVRNLALQLVTPNEWANERIWNAARAIHAELGVGLHDPAVTVTKRFTLPSKRTRHEDFAGNPQILAVIAAAAVLSLFRRPSREVLLFGACTLAAAVLFCLLFKWQPWHSRLHTPLFVLGAAFAGAVLSRWLPSAEWTAALVWLLVGLALPVLIANETRPLIPIDLGILARERIQQYFVSRPDLYQPYLSAITAAKESGCSQLGIATTVEGQEYPLRAVARQLDHPLALHQLDVQGASAKLATDRAPLCMILAIEMAPQWQPRGEFAHFGRRWTQGVVSLFAP